MPIDVHVHVVREVSGAGDRQDWKQFAIPSHLPEMGTYEGPGYQRGYRPKESVVAFLRVI
jgi:hypothetical protein